MFRSRNSLFLLGVAVVAFAAFLWVEGRSEKGGAPNAVEPGASLREGGRSGPQGAPADEAAAKEKRKKEIAALKARSRREPPGEPQEAADPELVAQLPRGTGSLVAAGPPRSPRQGILQQSFTGRQSTTQSTELAGEPSTPSDKDQAAGEKTEGNCGDCGPPVVRTTVVELGEIPGMRATYDRPCGAGSLVIPRYGKRFTVGDAPACAWLLPNCNGGAVAIFDDKFIVSAHGTCIPSLEYMEAFMQR
jgi:hypothetical protein